MRRSNNGRGGSSFGYIEDFSCFHINDFSHGDRIIAKVSGEREKGRVSSVNRSNMTIKFLTDEGSDVVTKLRDVILLSD